MKKGIKSHTKTKQIICFDLDNTLVRANHVHVSAFNKAFVKYGLPRIKRKKLEALFGMVGRLIIYTLFTHLTENEVKKIMREHNKIVINKTSKYAKAIKGIRGALKKLKKKYKIVIISNCTVKEIYAILKGAGINKSMFDLIIGHDMVKHPKPAPDELFKAELLMHIKKGYMVGDTIYDIRAAKQAGLKPIAVLTGNQDRKILMKEKPWKIINSAAELPKLLISNG